MAPYTLTVWGWIPNWIGIPTMGKRVRIFRCIRQQQEQEQK